MIMGGSMMGFTLPHADVPVVKITNCLLAPSVAELPPRDDEMNCIRCSKCAEVCPVKLLPQQLYWYSKAGDHENAEKYNLSDCIECGACAWVCPSNIPLVHYYRQEKAEIQHLREEAAQAERAKLRFEAKKLRLEEERRAREAHVPPVAARPLSSAEADPVAAAIMRLKAQQNKTAPADADMRSEREARKAQAIQHQTEKAHLPAATGTAVPADDARKAAVAAALARAKARKAEIAAGESASVSANADAPTASADAESIKKAAVAAAIARVKAKKAESEQSAEAAKSDTTVTPDDPDAARKAAVAAAIARAKAKKLQAEQPVATSAEISAEPADPEAAKKAAVAAAIARVKAKKAQAEAEAAQNKEQQE